MAMVSIPSMPIFRPDFAYLDHGYPNSSSSYFEKRQAFLRSYQFSRKRGIAERIRLSLARAKRVVWRKLRSARRVRRTFWLRLRNVVIGRRRFHRLLVRSSPSDYFCPSSSSSFSKEVVTANQRVFLLLVLSVYDLWPETVAGKKFLVQIALIKSVITDQGRFIFRRLSCFRSAAVDDARLAFGCMLDSGAMGGVSECGIMTVQPLSRKCCRKRFRPRSVADFRWPKVIDGGR
ncbi:hypothetical protein EJ110_NYTH02331 [Nymphaea thermarum]|nr:hypothetical protein EJ110_NYTH02331 [Nymphaea thermarum]